MKKMMVFGAAVVMMIALAAGSSGNALEVAGGDDYGNIFTYVSVVEQRV